MSLLELLGERLKPGPLGRIDRGPAAPSGRGPRAIVARAVMAGLVLLAAYLAVLWSWGLTIDAVVALFVLSTYLLAGYVLHPRPRHDNVGWLGGLVDDPFRWSDGANRMLVLLGVVLAPARFVTASLVEAYHLSHGRRTIVLPSRDDER